MFSTRNKTQNGFERLNSLSKSNTDRMIGGVCGGFAEVTSIPSWIWRTIFVLTSIFGGFGILIYLVLLIFMPDKNHIFESKNT